MSDADQLKKFWNIYRFYTNDLHVLVLGDPKLATFFSNTFSTNTVVLPPDSSWELSLLSLFNLNGRKMSPVLGVEMRRHMKHLHLPPLQRSEYKLEESEETKYIPEDIENNTHVALIQLCLKLLGGKDGNSLLSVDEMRSMQPDVTIHVKSTTAAEQLNRIFRNVTFVGQAPPEVIPAPAVEIPPEQPIQGAAETPPEQPVHEEPPMEPVQAVVHEEPPAEPMQVVHEEPPAEPVQAVVHEESPAEPVKVVHEESPMEPVQAVVHEEPPVEPAQVVHEEPLAEPVLVAHEELPAEPVHAPARPAQVVPKEIPAQIVQATNKEKILSRMKNKVRVLPPIENVTDLNPGRAFQQKPCVQSFTAWHPLQKGGFRFTPSYCVPQKK